MGTWCCPNIECPFNGVVETTDRKCPACGQMAEELGFLEMARLFREKDKRKTPEKEARVQEKLSKAKIEAKTKKDRAKLIFRTDMSDEELQNSINDSIDEIATWDFGSTLYGKLAFLFGDSTETDAVIVRLLRALFEQNKILIIQNELIRRTIDRTQAGKNKE